MNVGIVSGGIYGVECDVFIVWVKVVLNLYYYVLYIFEVVCVFYLMMNGKVIVGEVLLMMLVDLDYVYGFCVVLYDGLVDVCV